MNLRQTLILIFVSALMCSPASALDAEFNTFWVRFKDALQKNDKNSIADMTKLPFELDSKKLNKAQYMAKCGEIFPSATKKCLLKGKPIADKDSIFVFCGEEIFVFAKDGGKYKFIEIGVND